jgi:hypothetical protein
MSRRTALLHGLDEYPSGHVLGGCVNDVVAVSELLERKRGFTTRVVVNQRCTRADISASCTT